MFSDSKSTTKSPAKTPAKNSVKASPRSMKGKAKQALITVLSFFGIEDVKESAAKEHLQKYSKNTARLHDWNIEVGRELDVSSADLLLHVYNPRETKQLRLNPPGLARLIAGVNEQAAILLKKSSKGESSVYDEVLELVAQLGQLPHLDKEFAADTSERLLRELMYSALQSPRDSYQAILLINKVAFLARAYGFESSMFALLVKHDPALTRHDLVLQVERFFTQALWKQTKYAECFPAAHNAASDAPPLVLGIDMRSNPNFQDELKLWDAFDASKPSDALGTNQKPNAGEQGNNDKKAPLGIGTQLPKWSQPGSIAQGPAEQALVHQPHSTIDGDSKKRAANATHNKNATPKKKQK